MRAIAAVCDRRFCGKARIRRSQTAAKENGTSSARIRRICYTSCFMTFRILLFVVCFAANIHFALGARIASEKDARANATSSPSPDYPYEARRAKMTGSGVALLRVDPQTGSVTNATMAQSTGSPMLDKAALTAFRQWRFRPRTISAARLPIKFTLSGAPIAPFRSPPIASEVAMRALFAGTSVTGKRLNASELEALALYRAMPFGIASASRNWRLKLGIFLLSVRPDGTIGKVETLQATGHAGLDGEIIAGLKRWRFRPNTVKEVRVPAQYLPVR